MPQAETDTLVDQEIKMTEMSELSLAARAEARKQARNFFADRLVRDIVVQASLVIGLLFIVWFCTTNFLSDPQNNVNWRFLVDESKVNQPAPNYLPVDKSSSVLAAFGQGLLATMVVAVVGILLATVIGFFVGILRLSSNVLLSRLAQIYIEFLRNIPLAVQLLFLNAMLLTLPGITTEAPISLFGVLFHNLSFDAPALQFGDGTGGGTWLGIVPFDFSFVPTIRIWDGKEWAADWLIIIPSILFYVGLVAYTFFRFMPWLEAWSEANKENGRLKNRNRKTVAGFTMALVFTVLILLFFAIETTFPPLMGWSMLAVFFIAIFWGNAVRKAILNWADDRLDATGKRPNVDALAWIAMIGLIAAIFVAIGGPISIENYIFNNKGRAVFGFSVPVSMIALIGALAIYTSSFIAEIVRAGIQSVNKGQREAAASLGLRPGMIMNLIIIPQALKVIVPPLNSQYMNLAKNSSLAFILKYPDLVNVLNTTRNNTGRELEVAIMILLSYLTISLSISVAMNYVNDRVQLVER